MKRNSIKYLTLSLAIFAVSVIVSIITRMLLVGDSIFLGFTDEQANLVTSMIEGMVGALSAGFVVFQLRAGDDIERKQNDIEEAKFIFQYNQAFIQDSNMTYVEQQLEQSMLGKIPDSELIKDNARQDFINYLVYLEGLAPLILRDVIRLEHIDDLMAYRFFLAMNNPAIQKDQLFEFAPYYRGCFKLYNLWRKYRKETNGKIINEETSLDLWEDFEKYAGFEYVVRGCRAGDDLKQISRLIYLTDPYIYPAAFGSVSRATQVLPKCISDNESIFGLENIVVALEKDRIVGIAVVLTRSSNLSGPRINSKMLPKTYEHVLYNYFIKLADYVKEGEAYVVCVCVDPKARGKRVGDVLIKYIKSHYKGLSIRLHTLSNNRAAILLYEKYGLKKVSQGNGYSASRNKPLCDEMLFQGDSISSP